MKGIGIIFIILFLTELVFAEEIIVNLNRKLVPKTGLPYEQVKKFNPDIIYYDIIAGNVIYKNLRFTIAIYNANRNKRYDDSQQDMLIIGDFDAKALSIYPSVSAKLLGDVEIIDSFGEKFQLAGIDPEGKYVKLRVVADELLNTDLKLFYQMPNVQFTSIDNVVLNFHDYINKNKFIFVKFWSSTCHNCFKNFTILKRYHQDFSNKLTIIGLNINDSPQQVRKLVNEHNLKWIQGYSSKMIGEEFHLYGFNYGALFDPSGKLILITHEPREIEFFLD